MQDHLRKVPSWLLFIITIGLGLFLHVKYPTSWIFRELVVPFADALMIAGFLGLTVDTLAKNRLLHEAARDISKYLIGYRLPPEIQDHIRWIQTIDLVRCDCEVRYRLQPQGQNKMAVDVEMSYLVKNFSTTAKKYTPRLSAEDVDNPTFLSLTCLRNDAKGYHLADDGKGKPLDVQTLTDGRKRVEGEPVTIEPLGEDKAADAHCKIIKHYRLLLPDDYHDVISFFHPTIGVTIHVEYPSQYEIRIDEAENAISSGNCWEFRRLYLPSQIIGIRWLPKGSKGINSQRDHGEFLETVRGDDQMQPNNWILEKESKMEKLRAAAEKEWQSIIRDFPQWSTTDARRWAMSRFPTMLFMPVLGLCLRRTVLEDVKWWEAYSPGAGHLLFDRGRDEFDRHLKSKLLLDLAHNLEHPFRVILKTLDPSNRATNFHAIYRDLLGESTQYLKNVPPRCQEVLDLIRLSRNTVHNSWIHSPESQKNYNVTFKGVSYAFVVGDKLDFVSWDFLHDLAEEALRIMVAVVRDENVLALSAIPDPGAGDPISS